MKLRRLQLHGFKSFADRTELVFHDGITAVVGPNGCGKSNISDAIRWVLGEQRASAIRGSKMEEAIFQGTAERRPVNRAEVALTFSNDEQRLAIPYEEIQIRRTIFREGGSEYELNRTPCRLRDIVDLCRDTGLGALAYAVIEQRMVDGILSDRTDDRRQIFEEAAGVGRYKDRRRAAERRLEAARADLERLEDLIGEVESKVRSLARQRRQAQRYQEMRERRLALEVTLALVESEALAAERETVATRLEELTRDGPTARAALARVELDLEQERLAAAEVVKVRSGAAARLEAVAKQIAERDREIAVVGERRAHAERRLGQIDGERRELSAQGEALVRDITELQERERLERARLEELTARLAEVAERQQVLRQQVTTARARGEEAQRAEAERSRRGAELEAKASRGDSRAAEGIARLERLQLEEEELRFELRRLDEQGDLFADLTRTLGATRAERAAEFESSVQLLATLRLREAEARRASAEAEDRATSIAARVAALEARERDLHGLAPRTAAVLRARGELDGVLGPLAEFLRLPRERAAEVENALGSLLQVLVVRDQAAAERVRDWVESAGAPGEGTLAVIPQSALPEVERILEQIMVAGEPTAEAVLLGRRERLVELRAEAAAAVTEWEARQAARTATEAEAEVADKELRARESALQSVELELARAEAEGTNSAGQRGRLVRTLEELEKERAALLEQVDAARTEADQARAARVELEAETAAREEAWHAGRAELARLEEGWEEVRDEEAELRVVHAREEAAVAEVARRHTGATRRLEEVRGRVESLAREEAEHREALTQLAEVQAAAGDRVEELFRQRDLLADELRTLDERLDAASEAATRLEGELRAHRKSMEGHVEERHRLELRRSELEAALRSIRERVEVEWGRPFSQLVAAAPRLPGETPQLRAELHALAADLERLGPVNMLAIEEHQEESERLAFLTSQRDDLMRARDELQDAIRQINRRARELFMETFAQVRVNFHRTFGTLFDGGSCDLALSDPDDPLESDIEVSASPRGKRTQRIHLLSGGERALTALSLLFAIYLVKPSPFCVLDEVDAPLDESNVGRFVAMLQEFKHETQFIIITHNPRTIEAADWVYGVTMEEPGVSTMVGVQLDPALAGPAH
jgi:chromosome segregation protein